MSASDLHIDQTLHGYAGGHRLVSSSAKLQDADARTMLVLSDASTTRFNDPDRGVLTGYPLTAGSKYVLARTWPAPEMSRPGCVWTHSLLIGLADLATIVNAAELLSLFRRPTGTPTGYDAKLKVSNVAYREVSTGHAKAGALLNALYLDPASKVELAATDAADDEELILAVWLQQWPRLRRSFRFCSMVGADRSTSSEPFDLQIAAPQSSGKRSVVPNVRVVGDEPGDARLASAVLDLQNPSGLRPFLRLVGGDVPRGRSAMAALCQLYDGLGKADSGEVSYEVALNAFEKLGPQEARAARKIVAEHALGNLDAIDDRTLRFILADILDNDSEPSAEVAERLGRSIWRRSPRDFALALSDEGRLGSIVSQALGGLGPDDLARGVVDFPEIAKPLSVERPIVLEMPTFWSNDAISVGDILAAHDVRGQAVPSAIAAAGRSDAAQTVVHKFGAAVVIEALSRLQSTSDVANLSTWLDWCATDAGQLAAPLASGALTRLIIVELSKRVRPEDVPNDYGDDPWAIAARASGTVSSEDESAFAAFLMARALGRRSRSRSILFRMSFDRVHSGLANGSMPHQGWQTIERALPWPMLWGEWDRCARVREAVTVRFVDDGLDPEIFGWLTDSGPAFEDMAKMASRSRAGRHYLDRVRKAIQGYPEPFMQARVKMLKKLIS